MAITKNRQSNENIIRMAQKAFPGKKVKSIAELTEGKCNAAYRVEFEGGLQSVLKVAASDKSGFLTNEVNMMAAEVEAMRLVKQNTDIKVAEVFFYDTSKTLCDGEYFFMETLEGQSWFSVMDDLDEEVNASIRYKVGKIQKELTTIQGTKFGLLGDKDHFFENLYDSIYYLIFNIMSDAERRDVVIGVSKKEMLCRLQKDKAIFEEVKIPTLVHWDMWEGNIFVKDNVITGIIDWERSLWSDPFMDDRFRYHNRHEDFLRGFGIEQISEVEMRRIYWYDVFRYLMMMTEVTYREYEDDSQYQWVKRVFDIVWEKLCV